MPTAKLKTVLLATSMLAGSFGAAFAQEQQIEQVVVTGTHLQTGFETPTPVTMVGTAAIEQRAPSTISDVVNELPAFRQTATNSQAQRSNGNGGQNRVDLRGLGDIRTLVLVDGHRYVPTNNGGTVDVNMIPTPLVDRVDVVTGGASAAYGSDAVSGVVNFILKDHIDGLQGTVQYGITDRNDNREPTIGLAGGTDLMDGRLHLIAGGDYSANEGVRKIYTREWARQESGVVSFGALATRGSLPSQGLADHVYFSAQTDGSLINAGPLKGIAFGPGGVPFNFNYGTVYSTLMIGGANGFDGNPFGSWYLSAPHTRYTSLGKATFDLDQNTSLFVELNHSELVAPGLANYHQTPSLIVLDTNPYIPASVKTMMTANKLTSFTVGRYDTEVGGLVLHTSNRINRVTVGGKGALFGDWKWDAYYTHGVTDGNQTVRGNLAQGNYLAATYVVNDSSGNPVCGPTATNPNLTGANATRIPQIEAGCVPFNIFGRNSASAAAVGYIKRVSTNLTQYNQDVEAGNISGSPFDTWAGPVSLAAGIEHRDESASSAAQDLLGQQSAFLSNNGSTYSGAISVTEGYMEIGVPLAKDAAWARALDVTLATRETDYSTSGMVTTWKAGVTYQPLDDIRLRVTRSRDIRAPNISELFLTQSLGTNNTFVNPINNKTGQLFTVSGGNPNLKPEVANTLTMGVVLTPSWLDGLNFSVDYFNVNIQRVIASVAATDIVNRCAQGLTSYCSLITFDTTVPLGISKISLQAANLNKLKSIGMDFELSYDVPTDMLGLPGKLNLHGLATNTTSLTTVDGFTTVNRAGAGVAGVPGWVTNISLTYALDRWSATLQMHETSGILADATLIGPSQAGYSPSLSNSTNNNHFPAVAYFNLSGQYELLKEDDGETLQVFGVINNLMDKDPPDTALAAFSFGGNPYDVIGRAYKLGFRFKY